MLPSGAFKEVNFVATWASEPGSDMYVSYIGSHHRDRKISHWDEIENNNQSADGHKMAASASPSGSPALDMCYTTQQTAEMTMYHWGCESQRTVETNFWGTLLSGVDFWVRVCVKTPAFYFASPGEFPLSVRATFERDLQIFTHKFSPLSTSRADWFASKTQIKAGLLSAFSSFRRPSEVN